MSSFGEELRRERELRQITLREISESTKINVRYLEALERNDFKHLPGGVFNKGFVRAYAQHIGVDPETMVNSYLLEESSQSSDDTSPTHRFKPSSEEVLRSALVNERSSEKETKTSSVSVIRIGVIVAVILAIAAIAWLALDWFGKRSDEGTAATREASPRFAVTSPVVEEESTAVDTAAEMPDHNKTTSGPDPKPTERVPPAQRPADDPTPSKQTPAQPPVVEAATEGRTPAEPPAMEPTPVEQARVQPHGLSAEPEESTDAPAREPRMPETSLEATVVLVRPTAGRLNCDNRRVETLERLAPGTRMTFECKTFLLIDVDDGGALLVGLSDAPPEPIGADGVPVKGHHVAPPPPTRGETP